jgi:hypothetical protein
MVLGHGKHIGDTIISAIDTFHINHIIIGRRSMHDVKRLLLGSTSRYVVEHSTCSVAVVKEPHGKRYKSGFSFFLLLLARRALSTFVFRIVPVSDGL